MKTFFFSLLGALLGIVLVLVAVWLSGWTFQRGPDAVCAYFLCVLSGVFGATLGSAAAT